MRRQKKNKVRRYLLTALLALAAAGAVPAEASGTEGYKETPVITMIPEEANANGYYHGDVPVEIIVTDSRSGIGKVEYRVTSKGQETVAYQELYSEMEGEEPRFSYKGHICVKAGENDSAEVKVWLRVTGRDGNVYVTAAEEACSLKICTANPSAEVRVAGVPHREAKEGYYNAQRRAEVTVIDRADVFDAEAASKAILVGKDGRKPSEQPGMVSGWTSAGDRHSAVITFDEDGAYTWELSGYRNKAGLGFESVSALGDSPYAFTIDTEAPLTSESPDRSASWIGFGETGWSKLAESLTFDTWEKNAVTVLAEGRDAVSPVYAPKYYKTNAAEHPALGKEALDALYESGAFTEKPYTVNADEQFAVYARITDYAGNTAYISTSGVTVDRTAGKVRITAAEPPGIAGFYHDDVRIAVRVSDLLGDGTAYSGIRTVDYTVKNPVTQYTEQGNLYIFDKKAPGKEELQQEWEGTDLIVSAEAFDAGGIIVTVTAADNAGNESSDSLRLDICKSAPEITVAFHDAANREAGGRGYFGQPRKALITVKDRADVFDAEAVRVTVSAADSSGVSVPMDETAGIGAWAHEGNLHTTEAVFSEDGNYELSISYVNRAGLPADVSYAGETPQRFTVDTTAPKGTVTIEEHTWGELLSVLTFGLCGNTMADVTAEAEDATSPVDMEYYKTDHPIALTAEQLDRKHFLPYPEKGFTVPKDEQMVIYLKVTDYAGNYTYISSDGYIVDMTRSGISLEPKTADKNGIYNQDVKVAVRIREPEPYSGIKTVRYEVKKQGELTQGGILYTFKKEKPLQSELLSRWEGEISVDSRRNNSCGVVVSVFVQDNAGNESQQSVTLDIDVTRPAIKVSYIDGEGDRRNGYFAASRIAVVEITERTHHFDGKAAADGIRIRAVDASGKEVRTDREAMITGWVTVEGKTPDEAVHRAEVTYDADANYTVSISYTDRAGNRNTAVDAGKSAFPWKFTVDATAPSGTVTAKRKDGEAGTRTKTWKNELAGYLRFGFWSGKTVTVTARAFDETSPVASVRYYKTDRKTALTERELKNLPDEAWREFRKKKAEIVPNEQAVVYVKITDKAGNVSYISSGGIIADKDRPRVESFTPQIVVRTEQPVNGFYQGDVKVYLTVRDFDEQTKEPYSGLKTIRYEVRNMGEKTQGGIKDENPEGVLYSFKKEAPKQKELKKSWSGTINVDSKKNNSNQVVIKIYAEDNAGNTASVKKTLKIDITDPQISISYNNNSPDGGKYYNSGRTATITVTERNFDEGAISVSARNSDGPAPSVSGWKEIRGSGNGDDTRHIATVAYHEDGDYTFGISGADLAGNSCQGAVYAEGTTNPTEFTIDKTMPVISVKYDNNQVRNGRYFKEGRTQTVTILEHNFDKNRVKFTQTASKKGTAAAVPQASWSSSGDIHTAVFEYAEDGDYTFDVVMADQAGNRNAGVSYGDSEAGTEFTVDTGIDAVEITGVENGKSYRGEVVPLISWEDENPAGEEIRLFRTRKDEKEADVTEEFITELQRTGTGASCLSGAFEKIRENDGIYTLLVKISDLAGNEETETVTFTVNRFGSVYVFGEALLSLRDAYTQKVEENLVITEYNPDPLVENSLDIQITRDGMPLDHVRYTAQPVTNKKVSAGESGWYEYRYEIDAKNFKEDGIYKLAVSSEDEAGNKPETLNFGEGEVLFRVDTTPPEITDITGLEKAVVSGESRQVTFDIFDAIGLKQITVYVDGIKTGFYNKFDDLVHGSGSVTIQEGTGRKVRFVAEDRAGNITDTDAKDQSGRYIFRPGFSFERNITISTSAFVRWYADKRIFWRTLAGGAAVCLCILGLIKRRKKGKPSGAKREQ